MNIETARNVIAGLTYKPGWTFTVEEANDTHMTIAVMFRTQDSDVSWAPEYSRAISVESDHVIAHGECEDEAALVRKLFSMILEVELHEMREFFAIHGTAYHKPVHPHTDAGCALFDQWTRDAFSASRVSV